MEASFNVLLCELRIVIPDNLVGCETCFEEFQNKIYHDAGTLNTRLTMADLGINLDSF